MLELPRSRSKATGAAVNRMIGSTGQFIESSQPDAVSGPKDDEPTSMSLRRSLGGDELVFAADNANESVQWPLRAPRRIGMNQDATDHQLFDPRRGDLAFRLRGVSDWPRSSEPQRSNYFTVFLISKGTGTFRTDSVEARFAGPALLFFNPYQPVSVRSSDPLQGWVLQFHANFFCIETHHQAVGCNGVLFNNVYGEPGVRVSAWQFAEFAELIAQMDRELRARGVAQAEVLVALLKVFLVKATRLKLEGQQGQGDADPDKPAHQRVPQVLEALIKLIEERFKQWHAPADYAAALHMTPKALGKLVKARFGRTLTDLIRERLLNHAKWQLLHTTRSVKEIAWEVGFADELYFSRLFKRATGFAPTAFREFETTIRAGGNLSM